MNEVERQILKNQIMIMQCVFYKSDDEIDTRIEETRELLNPNVMEKLK